jgi:hypothetical protein
MNAFQLSYSASNSKPPHMDAIANVQQLDEEKIPMRVAPDTSPDFGATIKF